MLDLYVIEARYRKANSPRAIRESQRDVEDLIVEVKELRNRLRVAYREIDTLNGAADGY